MSSIYSNSNAYNQALQKLATASALDVDKTGNLIPASVAAKKMPGSSLAEPRLVELKVLEFIAGGKQWLKTDADVTLVMQLAQKAGLTPNNKQSADAHQELSQVVSLISQQVLQKKPVSVVEYLKACFQFLNQHEVQLKAKHPEQLQRMKQAFEEMKKASDEEASGGNAGLGNGGAAPDGNAKEQKKQAETAPVLASRVSTTETPAASKQSIPTLTTTKLAAAKTATTPARHKSLGQQPRKAWIAPVAIATFAAASVAVYLGRNQLSQLFWPITPQNDSGALTLQERCATNGTLPECLNINSIPTVVPTPSPEPTPTLNPLTPPTINQKEESVHLNQDKQQTQPTPPTSTTTSQTNPTDRKTTPSQATSPKPTIPSTNPTNGKTASSQPGITDQIWAWVSEHKLVTGLAIATGCVAARFMCCRKQKTELSLEGMLDLRTTKEGMKMYSGELLRLLGTHSDWNMFANAYWNVVFKNATHLPPVDDVYTTIDAIENNTNRTSIGTILVQAMALAKEAVDRDTRERQIKSLGKLIQQRYDLMEADAGAQALQAPFAILACLDAALTKCKAQAEKDRAAAAGEEEQGEAPDSSVLSIIDTTILTFPLTPIDEIVTGIREQINLKVATPTKPDVLKTLLYTIVVNRKSPEAMTEARKRELLEATEAFQDEVAVVENGNHEIIKALFQEVKSLTERAEIKPPDDEDDADEKGYHLSTLLSEAVQENPHAAITTIVQEIRNRKKFPEVTLQGSGVEEESLTVRLLTLAVGISQAPSITLSVRQDELALLKRMRQEESYSELEPLIVQIEELISSKEITPEDEADGADAGAEEFEAGEKPPFLNSDSANKNGTFKDGDGNPVPSISGASGLSSSTPSTSNALGMPVPLPLQPTPEAVEERRGKEDEDDGGGSGVSKQVSRRSSRDLSNAGGTPPPPPPQGIPGAPPAPPPFPGGLLQGLGAAPAKVQKSKDELAAEALEQRKKEFNAIEAQRREGYLPSFATKHGLIINTKNSPLDANKVRSILQEMPLDALKILRAVLMNGSKEQDWSDMAWAAFVNQKNLWIKAGQEIPGGNGGEAKFGQELLPFLNMIIEECESYTQRTINCAKMFPDIRKKAGFSTHFENSFTKLALQTLMLVLQDAAERPGECDVAVWDAFKDQEDQWKAVKTPNGGSILPLIQKVLGGKKRDTLPVYIPLVFQENADPGPKPMTASEIARKEAALQEEKRQALAKANKIQTKGAAAPKVLKASVVDSAMGKAIGEAIVGLANGAEAFSLRPFFEGKPAKKVNQKLAKSVLQQALKAAHDAILKCGFDDGAIRKALVKDYLATKSWFNAATFEGDAQQVVEGACPKPTPQPAEGENPAEEETKV